MSSANRKAKVGDRLHFAEITPSMGDYPSRVSLESRVVVHVTRYSALVPFHPHRPGMDGEVPHTQAHFTSKDALGALLGQAEEGLAQAEASVVHHQDRVALVRRAMENPNEQ